MILKPAAFELEDFPLEPGEEVYVPENPIDAARQPENQQDWRMSFREP